MQFLDLKDISERYIELVNPTSAEKVIHIGQVAGLRPGSRVIDFGCGYAEALVLWAEHFGIQGVGIEIREQACQRARQKIKERGFAHRIEIICGSAADYRFEPGAFDLAASIGTSFIWGGFGPALLAMRPAIQPAGKLLVGEPYWQHTLAPPELAQHEQSIHTEFELLQQAQQAGFDVEFVVRASKDDWDRYEASNWRGLLHWIEEHPQHPERQQVINHLHASQEEYTRYGREFFGWAIYLLNPVRYQVI
jgi:SAM-dependent methyltransferase